MTTVFEKLERVGIRMTRNSGKQTMPCPQCSHLRKKKNDKCLSVKVDGKSGIFHCHHCGWHGGVFEGEDRRNRMVPRGSRDKPGDFGTAARRKRYEVQS